MRDEQHRALIAAILTVACAYDSNPPDNTDLVDWITHIYWDVTARLQDAERARFGLSPERLRVR